MADGDTIFTMSSGKISADVNVVGFLAAEVVEKSIICAVKSADTLHGYISFKNLTL
jgi:L-aminopeptidase/D-esterase-like protein